MGEVSFQEPVCFTSLTVRMPFESLLDCDCIVQLAFIDSSRVLDHLQLSSLTGEVLSLEVQLQVSSSACETLSLCLQSDVLH